MITSLLGSTSHSVGWGHRGSSLSTYMIIIIIIIIIIITLHLSVHPPGDPGEGAAVGHQAALQRHVSLPAQPQPSSSALAI